MPKSVINYNKLFLHVKNLKKVLLVATGRTGSDFFQSLLDSHPQILHFTGIWVFHEWWEFAKCKNNVIDLINEFIWWSCQSRDHITKFRSCYNTLERWDKLGDEKNESFEEGLLTRLTNEKELAVYKHNNFWQCMDTNREAILLNELWEKGEAPWKIWN